MEILNDNAAIIIGGHRGNRYEKIVKQIAAYELIRAGKKHYNFLASNLKFPEISTTRKFINKELPKVYEGQFLFDEFAHFMRKNNLGKVAGVFEDATKINEFVEYNAESNTLLGLVEALSKEIKVCLLCIF